MTPEKPVPHLSEGETDFESGFIEAFNTVKEHVAAGKQEAEKHSFEPSGPFLYGFHLGAEWQERQSIQMYTDEQWVNCSDRLPKAFLRVLVIDDDGDCFIDMWSDDPIISNDRWEYYTHWQNLPLPPKQ